MNTLSFLSQWNYDFSEYCLTFNGSHDPEDGCIEKPIQWITGQDNGRVSFAKIPTVVEYPDLLNVQMESFEHFLQEPIRRTAEEQRAAAVFS